MFTCQNIIVLFVLPSYERNNQATRHSKIKQSDFQKYQIRGKMSSPNKYESIQNKHEFYNETQSPNLFRQWQL